MKIAPIDIAHKTFGRKMMGLDSDEVMDFLRQVADEYEAVIRERNQLKENLREREMAVTEYRERDELLKNTITTAQRMSEKIQTDAEREAKLIINDAQQKADLIIADSRDSLKKTYQEIADLKRLRMQFENNLKAIFQSHMQMLEQGQKIMPSPSIDPKLKDLEIQDQAAAKSQGANSNAFDESQASSSDQLNQQIRQRMDQAVTKATQNPY